MIAELRLNDVVDIKGRLLPFDQETRSSHYAVVETSTRTDAGGFWLAEIAEHHYGPSRRRISSANGTATTHQTHETLMDGAYRVVSDLWSYLVQGAQALRESVAAMTMAGHPEPIVRTTRLTTLLTAQGNGAVRGHQTPRRDALPHCSRMSRRPLAYPVNQSNIVCTELENYAATPCSRETCEKVAATSWPTIQAGLRSSTSVCLSCQPRSPPFLRSTASMMRSACEARVCRIS